jgi:hypothetical protein
MSLCTPDPFKSQYERLTKADFSEAGPVSAADYSRLVGAFRDKTLQTTGMQVAFGEVAKQQGGAWVRNFGLPLQYKFEGTYATSRLIFAGAFPVPLVLQ